MLVNDQDALKSPIAQKIRAKYIRVLRNQSHMDRDQREHGKVVVTKRQSGLLVSDLVVEVAEKRTRDIMSLIVRGLHHYYLHEPLPKDALFWIARLWTKEQIESWSNEIAAIIGQFHRGAFQCICDGTVFSCVYVEMFAEDHTTLWQLNFYGTVVFGVATNLIVRKEIASE